MLTVITKDLAKKHRSAVIVSIRKIRGANVVDATELGSRPCGEVLISGHYDIDYAKTIRGLKFWARLDECTDEPGLLNVLVARASAHNLDAVLDYIRLIIAREYFALLADNLESPG